MVFLFEINVYDRGRSQNPLNTNSVITILAVRVVRFSGLILSIPTICGGEGGGRKKSVHCSDNQ
jgi:hypothetical protein